TKPFTESSTIRNILHLLTDFQLKDCTIATKNLKNQNKRYSRKENMIRRTSNLLLLFAFIQLFNANEMQARTLKKNTLATMRPKSGDPHLNMLTILGGPAAGGRQNTCYFLKSKLTLVDNINFDGAAYFHLNGDRLYNANFSFGSIISFTAGVE